MMIADYQCPDCGATSDRSPADCCDECILKFYFENVNASNFADYREPINEEVCDECGSVHDQDEDEAMTIKVEVECDHEWGVEKDQAFCLKCMASEVSE